MHIHYHKRREFLFFRSSRRNAIWILSEWPEFLDSAGYKKRRRGEKGRCSFQFRWISISVYTESNVSAVKLHLEGKYREIYRRVLQARRLRLRGGAHPFPLSVFFPFCSAYIHKLFLSLSHTLSLSLSMHRYITLRAAASLQRHREQEQFASLPNTSPINYQRRVT